MTLGDRVVVMKDGLIQQVGPPLEVYRKPSNLFVATFIGAPAMNLVEGRIAQDGGSFEGPDGLRLALGPNRTGVEPGRSVTLGVRPQHLEPSADGMELAVRICEPLGDETDVMLDGPGGLDFTARLRLDEVPAAGLAMRLAPKPGTLHLFDTDSGVRLG